MHIAPVTAGDLLCVYKQRTIEAMFINEMASLRRRHLQLSLLVSTKISRKDFDSTLYFVVYRFFITGEHRSTTLGFCHTSLN